MEVTTTSIDYDTNLDIAMPTWLESMNTDIMMWGSDTFMMIWAGLNILTIVLYLLQTTGLFLINKKLGEKHAWLSFVPLLQIYNYFTASKKSFLHYFVLPLIALIIGWVLTIFTFGISIILAYIYFLVMWIKLLHAISLRCNRWAWTTIGFLLIPFIMMPIVGYKLGNQSNESENEIKV
jgi:hypothetical protein